ncbi:MAG TPA: hypothetical protein DCY79_02730 [Planctomycetaceae bacterium]|nr:hypothetical protein [Blastopirellula sp.]HAY78705.1 hypothetical protein [Planctomycetaceae bacterium]
MTVLKKLWLKKRPAAETLTVVVCWNAFTVIVAVVNVAIVTPSHLAVVKSTQKKQPQKKLLQLPLRKLPLLHPHVFVSCVFVAKHVEDLSARGVSL